MDQNPKPRLSVSTLCFLVGCLTAASLFVLGGCSESPQSRFPCGPKVLVFHAEWCHWCPTDAEINKLQADHPGAEIVSVDIDRHPDLATKYGVTKIPRFFFCDDEGCRTTASLDELKTWLKCY